MKFLMQLTLASILLVSVNGLSLAEETQSTPAPTQAPMSKMGPKHKMGMFAGMTDEQKEQHLRAKQEYQLKMHELSTQILTEKDSTKQEALKAQQRQLMKEHYEQRMQAHRM